MDTQKGCQSSEDHYQSLEGTHAPFKQKASQERELS